MTKRYLKVRPVDAAIEAVTGSVEPLADKEYVPTYLSKGRITAEAVFAAASSPPYPASAMDGYAVDFALTLAADLTSPVTLLKGADVHAVNTGNPLPEGTNAVIMREDVEEGASAVTIRHPLYLWQNVRLTGEDVIESDLLLPARHRITSIDAGLLIGAGITMVAVKRRPRLAVIPTGSEIMDVFSEGLEKLTRGRLIDVDSYALAGLADDLGFDVVREHTVVARDDLRRKVAERAADCDVTCVIAGSGPGSEDFTEEVIAELGTVIFHGIAMMPGKPTMYGTVGGKPVFGIPGYPVSAIVAFKTLVEPLYERLMGVRLPRPTLRCVTPFKIASRAGIEEVVRVNLIRRGRRHMAFPLPRGASILSSLAMADGLIRVPEAIEGYGEGEVVECRLLVDRETIDRRMHIVGSHDLSLDVLRNLLRERAPSMDLIATHVGSEGGILAMKRGLSDLATTHIIDDEERVYNLPAAKRYLPDAPWVLVHVVRRHQGILTAPGNPLGITGARDLARKGLRFVNRQFGSGTRILLDILLREADISPADISGYEREESSHTAVGILVKEGIADAGMAIYSMARIFSLHFVPLAEEDFDLLVSGTFAKTRGFSVLMEILRSRTFRDRMALLGGYDTSRSGEVKYTHRGAGKGADHRPPRR